MAQTSADQMVGVLAAAGVKRVYGVVGDSLNGFTDAIRRREGIEWLHVRHEEVAAFAAGADAHVTGGLAVEVAAPATCTLSTACSTASARAFRWWRSQRKFPRRDRLALFPGDASRSPLPGMLQLLRARVESRADAARARDRGAPVDSGALRQRRDRSRRRGAETRRSGAFAEAGRTGAGRAHDRAVGPVARRARAISQPG